MEILLGMIVFYGAIFGAMVVVEAMSELVRTWLRDSHSGLGCVHPVLICVVLGIILIGGILWAVDKADEKAGNRWASRLAALVALVFAGYIDPAQYFNYCSP